jgi:hypothetical protein
MCRSIKPLFNFDPPATDAEIHDAALQFVRKISGTTKPSKINEEVFEKAVEEISQITQKLLTNLSTNSDPKNREVEAMKAKERSRKRFGNS